MTEVLTKIVASGLICNPRNEVLLLRRLGNYKDVTIGRDLWEFPGGSIDPGETVLQALNREVKEETGLEVAEWQLREVINFLQEGEGKRVHRFHIFYAGPVDGMNPVSLSKEHTAHRWASPKD
jgi:8-oxo-dGTP diphosphatase